MVQVTWQFIINLLQMIGSNSQAEKIFKKGTQGMEGIAKCQCIH